MIAIPPFFFSSLHATRAFFGSQQERGEGRGGGGSGACIRTWGVQLLQLPIQKLEMRLRKRDFWKLVVVGAAAGIAGFRRETLGHVRAIIAIVHHCRCPTLYTPAQLTTCPNWKRFF